MHKAPYRLNGDSVNTSDGKALRIFLKRLPDDVNGLRWTQEAALEEARQYYDEMNGRLSLDQQYKTNP